MSLQNRISREKNSARIGQQERVIIDRQEGPYSIGRTQYDSPEVDTEILINHPTALARGTFHTIRITLAEDYDLYGEKI